MLSIHKARSRGNVKELSSYDKSLTSKIHHTAPPPYRREQMWQNGKMTYIPNMIITPKVTSLSIVVVKSTIDTFQPYCLTSKQRSVSEHHSLTAVWYYQAFTDSHCRFLEDKNPHKILRNYVSLTVPAGIFKPSIQRSTDLFQ